MKHYINSNGKIFAFEADGSQDHLIISDMQPITLEEVKALTTPSEAEQLQQWRASTSVTRFQAKAALDDAQLLDTVEAYMADPNTSKRTKLAWAEASFERDSNLVNSIGTELGLTDADIDNLFIVAKEIKV